MKSRCSRPSSDWNSGSSLASDQDRKSTRLNSSHSQISYAVFCLKKNTQGTDARTGGTSEDPAQLYPRPNGGVQSTSDSANRRVVVVLGSVETLGPRPTVRCYVHA